MKTDITWADGAWERFQEVQREIGQIRSYFGDALANEHEAEFLRTFNRITMAAGAVNVQVDGKGFYITTPYIVIGLVWSADSDEKRKARLAHTAHFHYDNEPTTGWPTTGTWSAHS